MNSERVSVKLIDDLPKSAGSDDLKRGSVLLVHSNTAAALVLSGAAVQLPHRLGRP